MEEPGARDSGNEKSLRFVIEPGRQGFFFMLAESWRSRELLFFLIWRDVSVRYKQTALGVLWALLQPLAAMVVFTLVFSRGLGLKSAAAPYPLFVLAGWIAWGVFGPSLSRSSESLVQNSNLVTKIYFPRMLMPAAAVAAFLPDFLISLFMLVPFMIYYRVFPGPSLLALPGLIVMLMLLAASVGTFFAALNVRFRDVKFIISFLTQMWFFATPVVYPYSSVPAPYRELMMLNPMTGIVEGFRWSLLGGPLPGRELGAAVVLTLAACLVAQVYFNRVERSFADVV